MMRMVIVAALALAGSVTAAAAAGGPADASAAPAFAEAGPEAYASHRLHVRVHRKRWSHGYRYRHRHAYYVVDGHRIVWPWWVTHPRWPSCYDRPPFSCPIRPASVYIPVGDLALRGYPTHYDAPAPVARGYVVRHRYHRRVRVIRVRG